MSKPAEHIWVSGIVAARDQQPYVQVATENGLIAQLTIAQARNIAFDIMSSAHNAEADAMIIKFFGKLDLPAGALASFMEQFRQFRYELEKDHVETRRSDPDTGEIKP